MNRIRNLFDKLVKNKIELVVYFTFFGFFSFFLIKGFFLIYPDLNFTYPFLSSDSYDWIANGLNYAGYDVNLSFRPPGLPLIIAFLESVGLLVFLPLINQAVLFGILALTYNILRTKFSSLVSLLSVLVLFFNFFLQNMSLYVLADIYAVFFIFLGFNYYIEAKEESAKYFLSSLFLSFSFLFQYAIVFFIPALFLHFIFFRKNINWKVFLKSFIPPLILIGGWLLFKQVNFGSFLYSGVKQVELLKFHANSILFYLVNTLAVFGILPFVVSVYGLLFSERISSKNKLDLTRVSLFAIIFWIIFWVFFYNWNDRRFVVYLIPFFIPFMALALEKAYLFFRKSGITAKTILVCLFFFVLWNSAISYKSFLSLDSIKLTENISLKFKTTFDEETHNSNIDIRSISIEKSASYPNQMNLLWFYKRNKKINTEEFRKILEIKNTIDSQNFNDICVTLEEDVRWYSTRNKYGNALHKKLILYPECIVPLFQITHKGLNVVDKKNQKILK